MGLIVILRTRATRLGNLREKCEGDKGIFKIRPGFTKHELSSAFCKVLSTLNHCEQNKACLWGWAGHRALIYSCQKVIEIKTLSLCVQYFFIGHLKQNYSTAELCLEELGGLMVWIPGYSSHARFNLEVDFSLLRETDDWAWWTLQLMLITGMKWAAPLLYVVGKSPKLAQKWGWKLLLRWGLSKSMCGLYKELSLSELLPGT